MRSFCNINNNISNKPIIVKYNNKWIVLYILYGQSKWYPKKVQNLPTTKKMTTLDLIVTCMLFQRDGTSFKTTEVLTDLT